MNASCHLNPNKGIRAGQPALSRGLYTNVTECACFSVCADKLFKVPGMSCDSAFVRSAPRRHPHLCCSLCVWCSFSEQSDKHKSRRMQTFFFFFFWGVGYRCLISLRSRTRRRYGATSRRDVIVAVNKAEAQPRTTSDGDSLLLPPFHRFGFLILPSLPPLIHFPAALIVTFVSPSFHFQSSDVSSWFSPPANLKGENVAYFFFSLFLPTNFWGFFSSKRSAPLSRSCQAVVWMIEKETAQSIWYLCVHLIESIGGPWETTEGGKSSGGGRSGS